MTKTEPATSGRSATDTAPPQIADVSACSHPIASAGSRNCVTDALSTLTPSVQVREKVAAVSCGDAGVGLKPYGPRTGSRLASGSSGRLLHFVEACAASCA